MNSFIFTKFPDCSICGSETTDYKTISFRCENCGYTGRMENNSPRLPLKQYTQPIILPAHNINHKHKHTMTSNYTTISASSEAKKASRKTIAADLKRIMKSGSVVHYLGGKTKQTPFENKFKTKNTTFVRYERVRSPLPKGYQQVSFNFRGDVELPEKGEKGYFVNDDFFNTFFEMSRKVTGNETYLWLDFCAMPTEELLETIYYTFLHPDSEKFNILYLTFFLNPRSCKQAKDVFKDNKSSDARANSIIDKLKEFPMNDDFSFEVFDTYYNYGSPMGVLKIVKGKEVKNKAKTANGSVQDYVSLHKQGLNNEQIAALWNEKIMRVAGFAASAKRLKLV
jgi:predicted RNA-binding Zn-ribbon protein involved in translation (DUF1610 family)